MQKNIKVIAVFLTLLFIFAGCTDENTINEKEMSDRAAYENEEVKIVADTWYPDVEKLKSVEEDKSLLKEKEEFSQLFKKFCGFSLPDYFIIPKVTDETDWNNINIDERFIDVDMYFIVEKNDALEMLDYLRKDYSWAAFAGKIEGRIITKDAREKCYNFKKSKRFNETLEENGAVFLEFIYDKDNDFYIVVMYAVLERDPPPGTSWPKIYYH